MRQHRVLGNFGSSAPGAYFTLILLNSPRRKSAGAKLNGRWPTVEHASENPRL